MSSDAIVLKSKAFLQLNSLMFGVFYVAIFSIIFLGLPAWASVGMLVLPYFCHIVYDLKQIIFYPFVIYPFMFIIRTPDDTNVILTTLPDLMTFFAVSYYLSISLKRRKINKQHLKLTYLIGIHAILTILVCLIHISDIGFIPILIRQYLLPLLFLMVVIRASFRNDVLPQQALMLSIISFIFVGGIALLNALQVIDLQSKLPELKPFLMVLNGEEYVAMERDFLFLGSLPRLNLLTGGALGSSASVFVALALICFSGYPPRLNKLFRVIGGLIFIICALMSASVSIITPVVVLVFLLLLKGKNALKKNGIIIILMPIFLYVVIFNTSFMGQSPLTYFTSTSGSGFISFVQSLNLSSIFIGVGPRITAKGFEFVASEIFIIDVGILRVFVETGLINFVLFISIMIYVFSRGIEEITGPGANKKIVFILLFFTFFLLVHANFAILPPFYPLFAASVAGIIAGSLKKTPDKVIRNLEEWK